jgi:hypothetical protein
MILGIEEIRTTFDIMRYNLEVNNGDIRDKLGICLSGNKFRIVLIEFDGKERRLIKNYEEQGEKISPL